MTHSEVSVAVVAEPQLPGVPDGPVVALVVVSTVESAVAVVVVAGESVDRTVAGSFVTGKVRVRGNIHLRGRDGQTTARPAFAPKIPCHP